MPGIFFCGLGRVFFDPCAVSESVNLIQNSGTRGGNPPEGLMRGGRIDAASSRSDPLVCTLSDLDSSASGRSKGAHGLELLGVFQVNPSGLAQFVDYQACQCAEDHDVDVRQPAQRPAIEQGV